MILRMAEGQAKRTFTITAFEIAAKHYLRLITGQPTVSA